MRTYCGREPLLMTWWSFEHHLARLAPYLMKLRTGRGIEAAESKTFNDALLIPKRDVR